MQLEIGLVIKLETDESETKMLKEKHMPPEKRDQIRV